MATTSIEWTDRVWNPVTGCSKVSPGCKHCYAETIADRFWATQYPPVTYITCSEARGCTHAGGACQPFEESRPRQFTDVQTHADRLTEPLSWRKPQRVFVNSMSDLFHEDVPDAFIDQVFAVMALAPRHTFQVLTKRAERMREYFAPKGDYPGEWYRRVFAIIRKGKDAGTWTMPTDDAAQYALGQSHGALTCGAHERRFLPNVWLGVSVENQRFADERIPLLLQTPAAVRFISAEPLLGPIDLNDVGDCINALDDSDAPLGTRFLDWVIVGGESGGSARPFEITWARSIVEQCDEAGVPVFVKQLGAQPLAPTMTSLDVAKANARAGCDFIVGSDARTRRLYLRDRKGGDPAEWPEHLRVRQLP
jgi:protein gp37